MIDNNGAKAAIRAGYKATSINSTVRVLRQNPLIREAIEAKQREILAGIEAMSLGKIAVSEEIRVYLTSVMRGESLSSVIVMETHKGGITRHKVVKKPPDEKERLRAAELLGKHYGLFTHKVSLDSKTPIVIKEDLNG